MTRRHARLIWIALVLLAIFSFPTIASLLTDWWWYQEIGYQVVFTREISLRIGLFLLGTVISTGVIYLNLRHASRGVLQQVWSVVLKPGHEPVDVAPIIAKLRFPVAAVLGLLFGLSTSSAWQVIVYAWYRTPFGTVDPIFQRDISYYVFTLPAIQWLLIILTVLTLVSSLLCFTIYRLGSPPSHHGGGGKGAVHSLSVAAAQHLGALLAIYFALMALTLWLVDIPSLVTGSHDLFVGANYTDLHVVLPALRLGIVVVVGAAFLLLRAGSRNNLGRGMVLAFGGYFLVYLISRVAVPTLVQRIVVTPTELTRESSNLAHHIAATRSAWELDHVERLELEDAGDLTMADIHSNASTIENVRLWDRGPLLQTFGQLQEIRTYYDFLSVDNDRYVIDGRYRQVMLSPRELRISSLPPQAHNFINEHLTYTHGMGLTLGPVNQVTDEGLPVLFIKDLPPVSNVSLPVTRPQLYYGEMNYDYAVTSTKEREFDHPAAEGDVYTTYSGSGGVPMGSLFRRLVFAIDFGDNDLFFSRSITTESKILYHRNIMQRAVKALPFLQLDRDPYLMIRDDGTLVWIIDGYTASSRYPYSQRLGNGPNYFRNSIKLTIDAFDGSMDLWLNDPGDPIIQTWSRVFPGLLHSLDEMPDDIRRHLRYPDQLFTAQTGLYATYHLDTPAEFYSREDQWQIPATDRGSGEVPYMRHIVMRLPGESEAEYVYMVPYTPRGRENLAAWMVARNDGVNYGKIRVYTLPRQSLVFGPTQIESRISQDTRISEQVSLWDRSGSKVIRGDLLVIPIERSLIYVQPLYLQAEGGRIPELKRVVVAYQNRVIMAETLDAALQQIFGGSISSPDSPDALIEQVGAATGANSNLLNEAQRHYDAAIQAQRAGDWARYGEEIKALGESLRRLRSKT